jgi:hypothetical protein
MSEPREKSGHNSNKDEAAQKTRERHWENVIERAEEKRGGKLPPSSPHDYVEREGDKIKK